jgi:hypothetical protein
MDINISAGTTFHVSDSAPVTRSVSEFETLTYTQVKGIRSIGDIGTQNETFLSRPLAGKPSNVSVGKGAQSVLLELYKGLQDGGQNILRSLPNTRFEYSFKVIQPDQSVHYFTATASSNAAGVGNGSQIADNRISLELTSDVVTG